MNDSKSQIGYRNSLDIVNYILKKGSEEGLDFTPMQMIKLVYLANGWFMAHNGDSSTPLIRDRVEAWKYGPVIPLVYHAVKQFRSSPITGTILGGDKDGAHLTDKEKKIINAIVKHYGRESGGTLSSLTHQRGTPWDEVYDGTDYVEIPKDVIFKHFKKMLEK